MLLAIHCTRGRLGITKWYSQSKRTFTDQFKCVCLNTEVLMLDHKKYIGQLCKSNFILFYDSDTSFTVTGKHSLHTGFTTLFSLQKQSSNNLFRKIQLSFLQPSSYSSVLEYSVLDNIEYCRHEMKNCAHFFS